MKRLAFAMILAALTACSSGSGIDAPGEDASDGGGDGAIEAAPDARDDSAADTAETTPPDADAQLDGADADTDGSTSEGGTTDSAIPDGGVCAPGARDCAGDVPRTCDATGHWTYAGPCSDPTPACVDGECLQCVPTDKRCTGTSAQTCDATGAWGTASPCPFACTGKGVCGGVCVPGRAQCSGTMVQTCDGAGAWQDSTTCPFVCTAGACTGECVPGAKDCVGATPRTCDTTGHWVTGTPCDFLCSSGTCAGACPPTATRCSGRTSQTCDANGAWQDTTACANACYAATCTGSCVPGTKRCASTNAIEVCSEAGTWVADTWCLVGSSICNAGACTPLPCVDGATKCVTVTISSSSFTGVSTCTSGSWSATPKPVCGGAMASCSAGACAGTCTPGATRCNGSVSQTCDSSGSWQDTTSCAHICTGAGVCSACTPFEARCSGSQAQSCDSSGTWQPNGPACRIACAAGYCQCEDPSRFVRTLTGVIDGTTGKRWSIVQGSGSWSAASAACAAMGARLPTLSDVTAITAGGGLDPACPAPLDQAFGYARMKLWTNDTSAAGHFAYDYSIGGGQVDTADSTLLGYACVKP